MLVLNVTFLLTVLVGGYLQAHAEAMGQTSLPADWQWWTTDMQNNYMSAIQATQGKKTPVEVVRGGTRMRIELTEEPPTPVWPDGITLRPFVPERDLEAVAELEALRDGP